ncbi:MAG TPA: tyrosine-type recombinase/integrase [Anaerolineales bacterium]
MDTLTTLPNTMIDFGTQANEAAARAVFTLYQERRPINTQRSQRGALRLFTEFVDSSGIPVSNLYSDPAAWRGISWGLVQAFQQWLIQNGYSMKTVNDRISVVKVYMSLANQAGIIPDSDILKLQGLRAYTHKEAIDTDAKRLANGIATRKGNKKNTATIINDYQAMALCRVRKDTPQARRDALMMCFLLDHGMRVSEVSLLKIEDLDLEKKQITFYRPKTGTTSLHNLRGRAWDRLVEYLAKDNDSERGILILSSCKMGTLVKGKGMTVRAINERVRQLGTAAGLKSLSPHDCRHYGATKSGNDPDVSLAGLMSWGGWSSAQSAAHYINRGDADNDGVNLGLE